MQHFAAEMQDFSCRTVTDITLGPSHPLPRGSKEVPRSQTPIEREQGNTEQEHDRGDTVRCKPRLPVRSEEQIAHAVHIKQSGYGGDQSEA